MLGVNLHDVHLLKDLIQDFLVFVGEQESMLVDMCVELFNHLSLVLLELWICTERETQ